MKIKKSGKSVTLDRDEIETLVKHLVEFEKITKALERTDAAGKLPAELKRTSSMNVRIRKRPRPLDFPTLVGSVGSGTWDVSKPGPSSVTVYTAS